MCATAWLLANDEEPEELEEFLVARIQRVLAERGSTLTGTELEALGVIGARASSPAAIRERARQLRKKIDLNSSHSLHPSPKLSDVLKWQRSRSKSPDIYFFSRDLRVTPAELEKYEAGDEIPELRTLSLLKGFVSDSFRTDPNEGTTYSFQLGVILEATLLKLAEISERSQAETEKAR